MNNFISLKNKFQKATVQSLQTQMQSLNQQKINNALKSKTKNIIVYNLNKQNLNFSSDWVQLLPYPNLTAIPSPISNIEAIWSFYYIWTIELPIFDIRLLSFIDIKILYRVGEGSIPFDFSWPSPYTYPSFSTTFQVEDIQGETSEWYKKVKIVASQLIYLIFPYNSLTPPPLINLEDVNQNNIYYLKLVGTFKNPRNY